MAAAARGRAARVFDLRRRRSGRVAFVGWTVVAVGGWIIVGSACMPDDGGDRARATTTNQETGDGSIGEGSTGEGSAGDGEFSAGDGSTGADGAGGDSVGDGEAGEADEGDDGATDIPGLLPSVVTRPTEADRIVIRIGARGIDPGSGRAQAPRLTVYGDGTAISIDARPNGNGARTTLLPFTMVDDLVRLAVDAGLAGEPVRDERGVLQDGLPTRVTIAAGGRPVMHSVRGGNFPSPATAQVLQYANDVTAQVAGLGGEPWEPTEWLVTEPLADGTTGCRVDSDGRAPGASPLLPDETGRTVTDLVPSCSLAHPTDPADIVMQVGLGDDLATSSPARPLVTIYGDGLAIGLTEAGEWRAATLDETELQGLLDDADAVGLLDGPFHMLHDSPATEQAIVLHFDAGGRPLDHQIHFSEIEWDVSLRLFLTRITDGSLIELTEPVAFEQWLHVGPSGACQLVDTAVGEHDRPVLPHETGSTVSELSGLCD